MTSPKEDQHPMTTRDELVVLADNIEGSGRFSFTSDYILLPCLHKRDRDLIASALRLASRQEVSVTLPRVIDNDRDEITVLLDGKELRGWSYASDQERRTKMLCAREYVEGFCDGRRS
jgi:hypothetical protein